MTLKLTTTSTVRSIEDDMTPEELELFERNPHDWGDAADAVARGTAYLDRVMPDWFTRVEILPLDLGSSCTCVLGQIFKSEAEALRDQYLDAREDVVIELRGNGVLTGSSEVTDAIDSGFGLAIRLWGMVDIQRFSYNAAHFFGFDHTDNWGYGELTDQWVEAIEARQSALVDA